MRTIIECPNCENTLGDYIGKVEIGGEDPMNVHKCLKCFNHVKTPISEGLNFA